MRAFFVAAAAAVLAACSVMVARAPAQPVVSAPQLYAAQCAGCHGAQLQGAKGPALKTAAVAAQGPDDLFVAIKDRMPSTKPGSLSDAEAHALTAFVVAQNKAK